MPFAAVDGFDIGLAQAWVNSGMPLKTALIAHPTLALLFGQPKERVDNVLGRSLAKIDYSRVQKLDTDQKKLRIPYRLRVADGGDISRADMFAAPTLVNRDVFDGLDFFTTYYIGNQLANYADMQEGKGRSWDLAETYEQASGNALVEEYCRFVSTQRLFAEGAGQMPSDGRLGSLRAMVSNGLNNAGQDDSAYANFLGADRASDPTYRSVYLAGGGAAFSVNLGVQMGHRLLANGAKSVVSPCSYTRFAALTDFYRTTYGQVFINEQVEHMLGGGATIYDKSAQVTYYLEPNLQAATWQMFLNLDAVTAGTTMDNADLSIDPLADTTQDAYRIKLRVKHQIAVHSPWTCGIIGNLASA